MDADLDTLPPPQHIGSAAAMDVLAAEGEERLTRLDPVRVLALGALGGGFITVGALFSVLLGAGATTEGSLRLLEGLGFSTGFFFVVLSGAVLFTEANVVLPAVLLRSRRVWPTVLRFWALAWLGNLAGAALVGAMMGVAITLSPASTELLDEVVATKLAAASTGTGSAWVSVVVSGVLANWLVGMAAFFATMGRTIVGKYVPVLLAVTAFVSAGFQHSPANMGFFSLAGSLAEAPDWVDAMVWNLLPAGIGNILGGGLAVAALLSWAFAPLRATGPAPDRPGRAP